VIAKTLFITKEDKMVDILLGLMVITLMKNFIFDIHIFNFYYWYKYGKKYSDWYYSVESFDDYLKKG
jgi:hypothetical protein